MTEAERRGETEEGRRRDRVRAYKLSRKSSNYLRFYFRINNLGEQSQQLHIINAIADSSELLLPSFFNLVLLRKAFYDRKYCDSEF